jgi:hypothetical protein
MCHESRWDNEHCQALSKRVNKKKAIWLPDKPHEFWYNMRPLNLSPHSNKEKKYTINTVGFAISELYSGHDRNTVELRLPECLLDEIHVRNWARLILHFVDFSRSCKSVPTDISPVKTVAELLRCLGLESDDEFVVADSEILGLKLWILRKIAAFSDASLALEAQERLEFITAL